MPLRLIFMGTPEFAVPTLRAFADAWSPDHGGLYARGEAGWTRHEDAADGGGAGGAAAGYSRTDADDVKTPEARRNSRAQSTCGCRRRLWHDPAAGHSRCAEAWLLQPARLAAAALARRRADQSRDPRRRCQSGVMVMKMDAGLDTGDVAMAERIAISTR